MNQSEYTDIKELHGYKIFKKHALLILTENLKTFLNCNVEPIFWARKYFINRHDIDIHNNPKRGFYPLDENSALILGRIMKNGKLISSLGFLVSNINIKRSTKLLNALENQLSYYLSQEFKNYFQNSSMIFGEEFIKLVICKYVAKGYYDYRQIKHLIEYFLLLRTTSFEGEYFSTGALFTKSHNFISGNPLRERFGTIKQLENAFHITATNKIEKRIWYLVDGKTSYFLGNKNLSFNSLFVLSEDYADEKFLDAQSLALSLGGGDFLIKVENEKIVTINTSYGNEFSFFENTWKYRDYMGLKEILKQGISQNDNLIDSILFFIINASKKQISTIIWFPETMNTIDESILSTSKNKFLAEPINILDKRSVNHIFRCLASDGACVFTKEGELLFLGVIAKLGEQKINGLSGTGESAASVLGCNGVAIKVSQDGQIKVYSSQLDEMRVY